MMPWGRGKTAVLALMVTLLCLQTAPRAAAGDRVPVVVVRVLDGDTVDVRAGARHQRVRFLGVDAPEVAHRNKPGEPFGRAATRYTADQLSSARSVELEVGGDRVDAYGRTLGFLWLRRPGAKGSVNLSEELLRQGLGRAIRHFEYPAKERFVALEAEAKRAGRGLWRH